MVSQQTKTFVVVAIALWLGYSYNSFSENESSLYYSGRVKQITPDDLSKINWTSPEMMERTLSAYVLGATGATGSAIVKVLASDPRFGRITLIGRRPVTLNAEENPGYKKVENQIVDFEKLDEYKDAFKGHDVGFSAMGTTRKKSPSAEAYYRVDHDYVVHAAKLAKEGGCQHLHLVSTGGANKDSHFTYMKTKGQVEYELMEMNFPRLSIYRPAVLLVEGGRADAAMDEVILTSILRPLDRKRWFSIDVPNLAKVMVGNNCFRERTSKVEIFDNGAMNKFARELASGNVPPVPEVQKDQAQNTPVASS